jgi:hypothetical protein
MAWFGVRSASLRISLFVSISPDAVFNLLFLFFSYFQLALAIQSILVRVDYSGFAIFFLHCKDCQCHLTKIMNFDRYECNTGTHSTEIDQSGTIIVQYGSIRYQYNFSQYIVR